VRALALLLLLVVSSVSWSQDRIAAPLEASVTVHAEKGHGSGVAFKNGEYTFVWTDAHVVDKNQTVKVFLDLETSRPKVSVTYKDVWFSQAVVQDGEKVGEEWRRGKIIRYSQREDIALCVVVTKNWLKNGTKFLPPKAVPKVGQDIWHIGSPVDARGAQSVLGGTLSFTGRVRKDYGHVDQDVEGYIYDQLNLTVVGGCSGGGVFSKETGECIGLVTEFLKTSSTTPGMCCMTPTRRLWQFAERNECLWAMDSKAPVPAKLRVITDDEIPVPDELRPSETVRISPAKVAPFFLELFGHPTPTIIPIPTK